MAIQYNRFGQPVNVDMGLGQNTNQEIIEQDTWRTNMNPQKSWGNYGIDALRSPHLNQNQTSFPNPADISGQVGEYGVKPGQGITASNVSGTDQGFFSKAKSMPLGLLNLLTRRQGATESFGGYPGGAESRAGLFPNEVTNLQRVMEMDQGGRWEGLRPGGKDPFGTNIVSQFGNYDEAMAKNLGVFEKTMAQKGFNTLDELENYYMETYGPKSYILNKLRHVKGWPGQGGKGVDKKVPPIDKGITVHHPQIGGNGGPTRDTKGWSSPGYTTRGGFTGTRGSPQGARGQSTPASGRGHHSWAYGGRVGYNRGGRVGILAAF